MLHPAACLSSSGSPLPADLARLHHLQRLLSSPSSSSSSSCSCSSTSISTSASFRRLRSQDKLTPTRSSPLVRKDPEAKVHPIRLPDYRDMDAAAAAVDTMGSSMPSAVMLNRHIPRRAASQTRRRSFNHAIRAGAKRIAQGADPEPCERLGLSTAVDGDNNARCALQPLLEAELIRGLSAARQSARLCKRNRPSLELWGQDEASEGKDLAHSEVPLPSDRFRWTPCLTLGREDAFRNDVPTARGKVRLCRAPEAEDSQIAQFYSMGLLYDNDKDAPPVQGEDDSGLSLNSIPHEQPIYTIRPGRLTRKSAASDGLYLNLSFSDLGDDNAIAPYLAPPSVSVSTATGETAQARSRLSRRQGNAPLRIVYDLKTSQPPELVTDLISDYDICDENDSEKVETPTRHTAHDSEDWVILGNEL